MLWFGHRLTHSLADYFDICVPSRTRYPLISDCWTARDSVRRRTIRQSAFWPGRSSLHPEPICLWMRRWWRPDSWMRLAFRTCKHLPAWWRQNSWKSTFSIIVRNSRWMSRLPWCLKGRRSFRYGVRVLLRVAFLSVSQVDCEVPLCIGGAPVLHPSWADHSVMNPLRLYLSVARNATSQLAADAPAFLEQEFIAMRQQFPTFSGQDFSRLITMGKYEKWH